MSIDDIQFFDANADWDVVERALPHWSQPGVVTFVTWRLADSLPRDATERLDREIASLLRSESLDPKGQWQAQLEKLPRKKRASIQRKLFAMRDKYLDTGYGECPLRDPPVARTVLDSLKHFHGERYSLTDAVVMPNHVHFLCAFASQTEMLKQCTEWKRFTARRINKQLNRTGELWQVDQFDHLVRSPEQFEHFRRYVANNPITAGLKSGQYQYYTAGPSR